MRVCLCEGARGSAGECAFAHTCACPCARPRPRPAPPRGAALLPPGGRGGRGWAGPSRAGTQVGAGGRGAGRVRGWLGSVPGWGLCAAVGGLPVLVAGGSRWGSCALRH